MSDQGVLRQQSSSSRHASVGSDSAEGPLQDIIPDLPSAQYCPSRVCLNFTKMNQEKRPSAYNKVCDSYRKCWDRLVYIYSTVNEAQQEQSTPEMTLAHVVAKATLAIAEANRQAQAANADTETKLLNEQQTVKTLRKDLEGTRQQLTALQGFADKQPDIDTPLANSSFSADDGTAGEQNLQWEDEFEKMRRFTIGGDLNSARIAFEGMLKKVTAERDLYKQQTVDVGECMRRNTEKHIQDNNNLKNRLTDLEAEQKQLKESYIAAIDDRDIWLSQLQQCQLKTAQQTARHLIELQEAQKGAAQDDNHDDIIAQLDQAEQGQSQLLDENKTLRERCAKTVDELKRSENNASCLRTLLKNKLAEYEQPCSHKKTSDSSGHLESGEQNNDDSQTSFGTRLTHPSHPLPPVPSTELPIEPNTRLNQNVQQFRTPTQQVSLGVPLEHTVGMEATLPYQQGIDHERAPSVINENRSSSSARHVSYQQTFNLQPTPRLTNSTFAPAMDGYRHTETPRTHFEDDSNLVDTSIANQTTQLLQEIRDGQKQQQGPSRALKGLPIPSYNGDADSRPFTKWAKDFDEFCNMHDRQMAAWEKLCWLKRALTGIALRCFDALPDNISSDYHLAMDKLKLKFGERTSMMVSQDHLIERKQRTDESVRVFATAFEELAKIVLINVDPKIADQWLAALFSRNVLERWRKSTRPFSMDSYETRVQNAERKEWEEQQLKELSSPSSDNHPSQQSNKNEKRDDRRKTDERGAWTASGAANTTAKQTKETTGDTNKPPWTQRRPMLTPRTPQPMEATREELDEWYTKTYGEYQCPDCTTRFGRQLRHTSANECPKRKAARAANAAATVNTSATPGYSQSFINDFCSALPIGVEDDQKPHFKPMLKLKMGASNTEQIEVDALFDTGCDRSIIDSDICMQYFRANRALNPRDMLTDTDAQIRGVTGPPSTINGSINIPIQFNDRQIECKLFVVKNCNHPFLFGLDLIKLFGGVSNVCTGAEFQEFLGTPATDDMKTKETLKLINKLYALHGGFEQKTAQKKMKECKRPRASSSSPQEAMTVSLCAEKTIRPGAMETIKVAFDGYRPSETGVNHFWPNKLLLMQHGLDCPESIININNATAILPIRNLSALKAELPTDYQIGFIETAELCAVAESHNADSTTDAATAATVNEPSNQKEGKPLEYDNDYPLKSQARFDKLMSEIDFSRSALTESEKEKFGAFLRDHMDVFAVSDNEMGCCELMHFVIDTGDAKPIYQPPRRTPWAKRKDVEDMVNKMEKLGIAKRSSSSWGSPIHLVKKKDGTNRAVVDFRAVNAVTKKMASILPRVDDLIELCADKKYKSCLDFKDGYFQALLDPSTADRSAFTTHMGMFQHVRLGQGLVNSAPQFSRLVEIVLANLNSSDNTFVSNYLDDVIITANSFDELLENHTRVFNRLRWAGLLLKPRKCEFARETVNILGFTVSTNGVKPIAEKTVAISEFPQPKNLTDVRSFIGMCSFYRKWIAHFASIADPLHALMRKNAKFEWTDACQTAFDELKNRLLSEPILKFARTDLPWVIESDASAVGLGCLLHQPYADGLHLVACASRALTAGELNYAPVDLETLGIVWACQTFRCYIYGSPDVLILTDNKPAGSILQGKGKIKPMHARWLNVIAEINPKIDWIKGKTNTKADALSRAFEKNEGDADNYCRLDIRHWWLYNPSTGEPWPPAINAAVTDFNPEYIANSAQQRTLQMSDPDIVEMIAFLEKGQRPKLKTAGSWAKKEEDFKLIAGVLYYLDDEATDGIRLVVPTDKRRAVFDERHSLFFAGHLNEKKVWDEMKRDLWWPRMRATVAEWTYGCMRCAKRNPGRQTIPPLTAIPVVGGPMEHISADIMQLPLTLDGNRYVIVFIDDLTKWPEAYAVKDMKAETVADCFIQFVAQHDAPATLRSDNGGQFLSDVFKSIAILLNTKQVTTAPRHPKANGTVEKFNSTLQSMLSKFGDRFTDTWDRKLNHCISAFRKTQSVSTGYSPFELLYGRDPRHVSSFAINRERSITDIDVDDYATQLRISLSETHRLTRAAIVHSQTVYKKQYDKTTQLPRIEIGNRVFVLRPDFKKGEGHKMLNKWDGPYRVKGFSLTGNAQLQHLGHLDLPLREEALENIVPVKKQLPDVDIEDTHVIRRAPLNLHPPEIKGVLQQTATHNYGTRSKATAACITTARNRTATVYTEGNMECAASEQFKKEYKRPASVCVVSVIFLFSDDSTTHHIQSSNRIMEVDSPPPQPIVLSPSDQPTVHQQPSTQPEDEEMLDYGIDSDRDEESAATEGAKTIKLNLVRNAAMGIVRATNVNVIRVMHQNHLPIRTTFKPSDCIITSHADCWLHQDSICNARRDMTNSHKVCRPVKISDVTQRASEAVKEGVLISPSIARFILPLVNLQSTEADKVVLHMLKMRSPTANEDVANLFMEEVEIVMRGNRIMPLTPTNPTLASVIAHFAHNCNPFALALHSTGMRPIIDATPPYVKGQKPQPPSLTCGGEIPLKDGYAAGLDDARYAEFYKETHPHKADGVIHVIGDSSMAAVIDVLATESRKIVSYSHAKDLEELEGVIRTTYFSHRTVYLVICCAPPSGMSDDKITEWADAYCEVGELISADCCLPSILLLAPLPRLDQDTMYADYLKQLEPEPEVHEVTIIKDYRCLELNDGQADRWMWKEDRVTLNALGAQRLGEILRSAGLPWAMRPYDPMGGAPASKVKEQRHREHKRRRSESPAARTSKPNIERERSRDKSPGRQSTAKSSRPSYNDFRRPSSTYQNQHQHASRRAPDLRSRLDRNHSGQQSSWVKTKQRDRSPSTRYPSTSTRRADDSPSRSTAHRSRSSTSSHHPAVSTRNSRAHRRQSSSPSSDDHSPGHNEHEMISPLKRNGQSKTSWTSSTKK